MSLELRTNISVTLKAVGDIAFFKSINAKAKESGKNSIFENVENRLNRADIIFGNFEFPFSKKGEPNFSHSYEGYRGDFDMLPHLSSVRFSILNLANNHVMDWGVEGLETTKNALNQLGIETVGAGVNLEEARKPVVFQKNGIKFGFLGYTKSGGWIASKALPGAAKIDKSLIKEDISALRRKVNHIIVSLHWGIEFSDYPYPDDIEMAHEIINMGSSVILGHHPHVIQGYEKYNNGVIFYSLGNFVYDPFSERVFVNTAINKRLDNMIVEINFLKNSIISFSVIPTKINDELRPIILVGKEKERLLNRIELLSDDITNKKNEFYRSAFGNLFERELKTSKLLLKQNGWKFIWSRIRVFKLRHIKLLIGYLMAKVKSKIGLTRNVRR